MLTYLSVDETLIMWCVVAAVIGFWFGVLAHGYHRGPAGETYVYEHWWDHFEHGKKRFPGE